MIHYVHIHIQYIIKKLLKEEGDKNHFFAAAVIIKKKRKNVGGVSRNSQNICGQ